ncbi:MAG: response regulator [Lachnospiraceae bacterium]|nr:response regulator [Lachnospiraceae bacterium]
MKSKSKKQQITLPVVLVAGLLLIIVISGIYFMHYLEQRIYEERRDQLAEITSQVEVNLNNILSTHWDDVTVAANLLEVYEPETMQETSEYLSKLERILETESHGSRFVLLDSQGNCYDVSGYRGMWPDVHILASGEDRYSFISDSYIYQGNYWKFVQKLNTPIYISEDDVTFTYIALLKDMLTLTSYCDSGAYDGHNETYILKSDGTRVNEGLFQDRLIQSYSVLNTLENMEGQRYSDIRTALEQTDMLSSNFFYDDEEYYYCIASLNPHEAFLLFLIPARFVATETVGMVNTVVRTLLVLTTFLLILMALAIISILRHQNSVRIALQEHSSRMRQEELNARLEESNTLLSESKKAVEQSLKMAEDANRAKSVFLSHMSHEIRTPINSVLGMNEMILRECTDKSLLSYAENIQSSGKTLLFLINDILDMSKIESGKMEIVPVEYETADMIIDLWNGIYLRAQGKNLTVDFSLDSTLPRKLFGDDMRIKQIVTNLLTNAVKYTSEGGIELRVDYKRTEEDRIDLIISVKDTGMGIRKEDMSKLFESFRRIEEEKNRNIEGTGLGMNIVMSLLQLMDGDIKVDSEYQKGSTFTVTIPQKVISGEATGDFQSIMGKQRSSSSRKRESFQAPEANVLVVDDNRMNLDVFKALLKRTKMNVVTADSGMKCLEVVKEQYFNIIFLDHMMPGMDGIETLHEIQKLSDFPNEGIPVIALTANVFSGGRESYLKEGFTDYLTKPIDSNLLDQMILSYLPEELVQIPEQTEGSQQQKSETADGEKAEAADDEKIETADDRNTGVDDQEKTETAGDENGLLARLDKKGFSAQAGLQYCNDDIEFYEVMLNSFVEDAEGMITDIQNALQGEGLKDYAILVHGLKGMARTIGANTLSEKAKDLELAAKKEDTAYVNENHEALMTKYRETVQTLLGILNFE